MVHPALLFYAVFTCFFICMLFITIARVDDICLFVCFFPSFFFLNLCGKKCMHFFFISCKLRVFFLFCHLKLAKQILATKKENIDTKHFTETISELAVKAKAQRSTSNIIIIINLNSNETHSKQQTAILTTLFQERKIEHEENSFLSSFFR